MRTYSCSSWVAILSWPECGLQLLATEPSRKACNDDEQNTRTSGALHELNARGSSDVVMGVFLFTSHSACLAKARPSA